MTSTTHWNAILWHKGETKECLLNPDEYPPDYRGENECFCSLKKCIYNQNV